MRLKLRNILKLISKIIFVSALFLLSTFSSCTKDVSVTPPDAPPPNGYLFINSYPSGFQIYLNGLPRRRATPDSLTWLSTNSYSITLKKNLFRDTSFTVNVVEGIKKSVFVDYSKNPAMLGSISLTSNPANAMVFINDSSINQTTPVTINNLMPGNYLVRFHAANHRDDSTIVTVSSSNTTSAQKTLVDTTLWSEFNASNSSIATNQLTCIAIDNDNSIWMGTPGWGLLKFDGRTWENLANQIPGLASHDSINCIYVDQNNHKWVGTEFGGVLDVYNNIIHAYGFMSSGLSDFRVTAITSDNEGVLYFGTKGGLNYSNVDGSGNRTWKAYSNSLLSIPSNEHWITALAFDSNKNLWIGTKSSGIVKFNQLDESGTLFQFTSSNLINNAITSIVTSGTDVWAGHGASSIFGTGISHFNGNTWEKVYPIPQDSYVQCIFIDRMNNMWIGTDKGLVKYGQGLDVLFDSGSTGLNMDDVRGIAEDQFGNIWIATYSDGLIEFKGNK